MLVCSCSGGKAQRDGEFVVGIEGSPATLDPRYAADAHGVRIIPLLFRGLLKITASGEFKPDLAESWLRDGPLIHRLTLKKGILFHDGTPLHAKDVAATYRFIMDRDNGCPRAGGLSDLESVETPDDRTLVFTLSKPFNSFPFQLTIGILPERLASRKDIGDNLIGTGPYKLAEYNPGSGILLERNDAFSGEVPGIEKIRFRIISNATTRLLEIQSGGLDLLQNAVPPYSVKFLKRAEGLDVYSAPGTSYQYLGYNLKDEITGNPLVRKAISHAVDRQALIAHVIHGLARPATTLLPPEHWAHNPEVETYDYDLARAGELLDRAGFPDPDGDGPGHRFTLSYKTSTDKTANMVAQVIGEQLARVGINLEIVSFEWGTFFSDVKKGNFQLMSLRWIGIRDPDVFHYLFHSSSMPPNGANRGRYEDDEVDGWIEQSRLAADDDARRELYFKIQARVAEDCVYTSLWWLDNVVAMTRGYEGYEPLPGGEYSNLAVTAPGESNRR